MTRSFSEDFGPFEGRVWLNCAHQGPLPPVAAEAASEALAWKTAPHRLADESFHSVPQRMKRALGQLIGVSPDEIILGNSTSYGLHLLANGIPWQRGDEVLLAEGDFPANILPWLALRERGASGADANRLEAVYEVPFLAHVTPEPMNCVADVRAEGCDVWASTQNPGAAKGKALSLAGVPREAIRVHVPLVGVGLGAASGWTTSSRPSRSPRPSARP